MNVKLHVHVCIRETIGDTERAPIISPPLGVPAAYLCTPADVIKTRLQVEREREREMYVHIHVQYHKHFKI